MNRDTVRCKMCYNHYPRGRADHAMILKYGECVVCRARTLYFAECIRAEPVRLSWPGGRIMRTQEPTP